MCACKPLVSIITPVYNCQDYLAQTIDSILRQTFKEWELILIDDCSEDESLSIVQKYVSADSRIILKRLSVNSGPAVSRNEGIKIAKGRYIAFCDSDDIWCEEKLCLQISAMNSTQAKVCFTSYYKMLEDGIKTKRIVRALPEVTYDMLLNSNFIGCSTAMYDTSRCGKVYMPDIIKRQDYGLWLRILSGGGYAIGLCEPLVYYRLRSNSVSSNKFKAAQYHWKVLRDVTDISFFHACIRFLQYVWIGFAKRSL